MKNLNLGTLSMPPEAATKTFALLAKRGAGKSYTGAVMAEEFHKVGIPFVVFDPIDVWWGLRLNKDGKNKGLPVVVFGLEHADIPLERDMGAIIAQAIVHENISCVISTFGMPKVGQRQLIAEFAEELLRINNTPRHIFIEEAHEFVPQRVFGAMGKTFAAVESLVVMGRNRGLGVTLVNQRAATINKDVLTQIDTLIALRNVAPQDRKALKEWVEAHSAEGDFEQFIQSLPSLPTGEAWVWSPEFLETFERIKIRERETFHPDREKLGTSFVMPRLEQGDIQTFIDTFKHQVVGGKSEMEKKSGGEPVTTLDVEANRVKILEDQLKTLAEEHQIELDAKDGVIEKLEGKIADIKKIILDGETTIVGGQNAPGVTKTFNDSQVEMWAGKLKGGAARILKLLAEKYPLKFTRNQIALLAQMSARGGAYNRYFVTLKRNNLIKMEGDMVSINPDLLK